MKVKEEEEEKETEMLALWVYIHVANPQQLISTKRKSGMCESRLIQKYKKKLIGPTL